MDLEVLLKGIKELVEKGLLTKEMIPSGIDELGIVYRDNYLEGDEYRLVKHEKGNWIDMYANETVELKAGESKKIDLGVGINVPEGFDVLIAPRSSTYKNWGITLTNSLGIGDDTFVGPGDFYRFPALAHRDTKINKGDRICQFRLLEAMPKDMKLFVAERSLGEVTRGGFGSTGDSGKAIL